MIVYIQWSLVTVHFPLVVWRYYGPRSRCRVVLAQGTLLRKHPSLRAVRTLLFAGFHPKLRALSRLSLAGCVSLSSR